MTINVIKRDGTKQPLDLDRFHKVVANACKGLSGVSESEIEIASQIQFYNNIKSSDIQETLIKATSTLIKPDSPNYQFVAGRLINYHLRKEVYGQYDPIHLLDHVKKLVKKKLYDKAILTQFSTSDFNQLNKMIDHHRDDKLTYAAMEQFRGKYLVKDRTTGQIFETPQMAYLLIAATLFAKYPTTTRMKWIKDYYDAISEHKISIPTPVLAGVRTPTRQFSSCTLIEVGDSLNSIIAGVGSTVKYISARAGIGLSLGGIRAEGDGVNNGEKKHTGGFPFWRLFESAVKSCSQGGLRGGSATANFHFFHMEAMDFLELKNNKGTPDTRIKKMDYCIHLNRLFLQRYIDQKNISLFSPKDVPELMKAFYENADNFEQLYIEAESSKIRRKTISAKSMMDKIAEERTATGRVYVLFVDHANDHSSFISSVAPIKMTNLCVEITLPTKPEQYFEDPDAEIALCILSALNFGLITEVAQFEPLCQLVVRGLNALIDHQDYQVPAAKNSTLKRRPIGVGIVNLAYWLAKNNTSYSNCNFNLLDEYTEAMSFYLIKASMELAKEQGSCPAFNDTKYSQGIFPIDTYKKNVDTLTTRKPTLPWEWLKEQVKIHGMANSTLMAGMPGESSSIVLNATSGVDPIRSIVTNKDSKDGTLPQVAPGIPRLTKNYEALWDMKNSRGVLEVNAVIQKWFDQAISTNTSYNPENYPNQTLPLEEVIHDILYAYSLGLKTLYYQNTLADTENSEETEESCEGCSI